MIKLCSSCVMPICDFCIHYCFNGETVLFGFSEDDIQEVESYIGDGFCLIDKANRDPNDWCDNFVCFNKE